MAGYAATSIPTLHKPCHRSYPGPISHVIDRVTIYETISRGKEAKNLVMELGPGLFGSVS